MEGGGVGGKGREEDVGKVDRRSRSRERGVMGRRKEERRKEEGRGRGGDEGVIEGRC